MRFATRVALSALLVACVAPVSAAPDAALPDLPYVSTLAGPGQLLGPQGLAYDARGTLYVADTPAQRIRAIDPSGTVTTVAGSGALLPFAQAVSGGYRDGAAASALFNQPTGVAVAADGTIYVADTGNRAIRAIKGGVVTTVVGGPDHAIDLDGPAAIASIANPRGIAVDSAGTIYVADPPDGVRRIQNGVVTTLHGQEFDGALNLSIYERDGNDDLVVALPTAVGVYDIKAAKLLWGYGTENFYRYNNEGGEIPTQGAQFGGPASAAIALNPQQIVYSDAFFSTVHWLVHTEKPEYWYTRVLGEQPLLNANMLGGGFHDGPGDAARYNRPMGVALAPDGSIAVADTGNRRIRLLSRFDGRTYETVGRALPQSVEPTTYRIVILGDSYVWANMAWHDSLAGVASDRLCARASAQQRACNVQVYPIRFDGSLFPEEISYAKGLLADGIANEVIIFVTSSGFLAEVTPPDINVHPSFLSNITPMLRDLNVPMKASNTRLVVLLHPDAWDVPNEMSYRKLFTGTRRYGAVASSYATMLADTRASGVGTIDLWPSFFEHDAQPGFRPLFGAWDHHFTIAGNRLVGEAIAADALRHGAP
jgi:streptogramin lyase